MLAHCMTVWMKSNAAFVDPPAVVYGFEMQRSHVTNESVYFDVPDNY